jgi:gamma-glutamylaminecyclotransferase
VNAATLAGARYLGPARTVVGYSLVALSGYPGLRRGGGDSVPGELYLVDGPLLAALDEFEEHPTLFCRTEVALAGGATAQAYLVPAGASWGGSAPVIPGGDWRRHRLAGGRPTPGGR